MSSVSSSSDEDESTQVHFKRRYESSSSDYGEEPLDKPPTAFAACLLEAVEQDREPADGDSKYTAFWLDLDLPLSSQYKSGCQFNYWELRIKDPSSAHPDGKFICASCEHVARLNWDPFAYKQRESYRTGIPSSGSDEAQEKLSAYEGKATLSHLRQHAASRQHILNHQFGNHGSVGFRRDTSMRAHKGPWVTPSFKNHINRCIWRGGPLGWSGVDDYIRALKKVQMGNHVVAQVLARHKARQAILEKRKGPITSCDDYNSDDSWPEMAEKDDYFPFAKANKKPVIPATRQDLAGPSCLQAPAFKCIQCHGHHPLKLCCCGKKLVRRPSEFTPKATLSTCPDQMCGASVQQTERKWSYSFEAECLRFGVPYRSQDDEDERPALPETLICSGVLHDGTPALAQDQPSQQSPDEILAILQHLQDVISARPGFAELYASATDKKAFVEEVKPFLYVGTQGKARSSFCQVHLKDDTTVCAACEKMGEFLNLLQQDNEPQGKALPDLKRAKMN